MTDPLCQFAHRFPHLAAQILHGDRNKRRNFKEETITDLLMAGMTAFEPFGVIIDFPVDESKTGEDMDWEFVAPYLSKGPRYLRLHIQAKRAIIKDQKVPPPYWFYRELDHESGKGTGRGSQARRLIDHAKAIAGCVPMYMFYHPMDALEPADGKRKLPAIEGVNLMFADALAPVLAARPPKGGNTRWPDDLKKVETWRPKFMALPDLLCFGSTAGPFFGVGRAGVITFALWQSGLFSPDALAKRLNELRPNPVDGEPITEAQPIEAIEEIPQSTLEAIEARGERRGRAEIERPRAIFLNLANDELWEADQHA